MPHSQEEIREDRLEVERGYKNFKKIKKELSEYQMDQEGRAREIDFLEFEINEIESASLIRGEDEQLEQKYKKMFHARKIAESLNQVYTLSAYEDENGAGEQIGRAIRELSQISGYDSALGEMEKVLTDIEGLLNDFNRELSDYQSKNLIFSEEEFIEVENRLDDINHLKSKYGNSIDEILDYQQKQNEKLQQMLHYEERKEKLAADLRTAEEKLEASSHNLSEKRRFYSNRLEKEIVKGVEDLNFESVKFKIDFQRLEQYTQNGYDSIEFQISTNPGEKLKSLAKVVSGGELSRIMLAIKTILADKDDTETLIFDEIDTGISGRTASRVAEKMNQIGKNHQVLAITHLPQIAAMADKHFEISKFTEGMKTKTIIQKLSEEESIMELARILGGAKITKAVEENAKEMKELARIQKSSRL